ncbi:MAG: NAD(P)-dependent alcohol dehydrogenase [Acidobacteriota bacterium]
MKVQAYAAKEARAQLEPWEYEAEPLRPFECRVRVQACGICHSDIHMIDNDWGMSRYPLVPGHEVVGVVTETGEAVTHLRPGDRVGIGWQSGACMQCPDCLGGNENLCDANEGLIVQRRGGFADYVQVDARFAFPLPAELPTEAAGPLLCGGITVYSALRHAGMTSGREIGVIGLGGLGHLALLFASRLGNRVTVFTTTAEKAEQALRLGAAHAVVLPAGGQAPKPERRLQVLLNTAPIQLDWSGYLQWLDSDGTLVLVAGPAEPIQVPFWDLLLKRRRVMGSPIGGRKMITEMLQIAAAYKILPQVETYALREVNRAVERVRANQVRYRAVLLNE